MSRRYYFPGAAWGEHGLQVEPLQCSKVEDTRKKCQILHVETGKQATSSAPAPGPACLCLELALLITLHLYSSEEVVSIKRVVRNGAASPGRIVDRVRGQLKSCYRLDRIVRELQYIAQDKGDDDDDDDRRKEEIWPDDALGLALAAAIQYSGSNGNDKIPLHPSLPDQIDFCLEVFHHHAAAGVEAELRLRLVYRRSFMSHREATRIARTLASIVSRTCACHISNGGAGNLTVQEVACMALDVGDRSAILRWNSDQALKREHVLVHDMFSSIAVRHADTEAIVAPDGCMTYAELEQISSVVASYLRLSATSDDRWIALCFTKSYWAVVGMLAVLKSGRGCIFLDPSWPDERLCGVLRAIEARYILTHGAQLSHRLDRLSLVAQFQSFNVADIATVATATEQLEEMHHSSAQPGDNAFAVFTSGSTGIPKGVGLTHANVCTAITGLTRALAANAPLATHDRPLRVLQFAAYAFDASLSDMLVALLSGGTVCIPSDAERTGDLQNFILDQEISLAFLTPTVARTLTPAHLRPILRLLVLIGEPVTSLDKDRWLHSGIAVFNGYGPTESTFGASLGPVVVSKSPSNIGHPLGYRFWVVNTCSNEDDGDPDDINARYLLPIGATGELVLEGPALAQGYLNDAELTEARFTTGPAWLPAIDGEVSQERRVYRTGDLVRYHEDGSLECLGRVENDRQVKVGGQRLELAEIEHHLIQAAATAIVPLQDVTVCLPRFGLVSNRLVALIVLTATITTGSQDPVLSACDGPTKTACAGYLSHHVPPWMVPSIWLRVSHFPTTLSGKKDYPKLLSALTRLQPEQYLGDRHDSSPSHDHTWPDQAATGPSHFQELVQISSEILQLPIQRLLSNCSFVELGGDSIAALQVSTRMRKDCSLTLSTEHLMACSSLYQAALEARPLAVPTPVDSTETSSLRRQVLRSFPELNLLIERVFPCSPVQESLLFHGAQRYQNMYAVSATWIVTETRQGPGKASPVDAHIFTQAWQHVVQNSEALRTVPLELLDVPGVFANTVLKDNSSSLDIIQSFEANEINSVKDLPPAMMNHEMGQHCRPPLKLTLCYGPTDRALVRLDASHALLDGLSVMALIRQLSAVYQALRKGSPARSALQTSSQPMQSYVALVRDPHRCKNALEYWRQYLADAQPCLFPRLVDSEPLTFNLKSQRVQSVPLRGTGINGLSGLLAARGLTPATFFIAIWSLVMRMYVNTLDVIFGYVSSGRDNPSHPVSMDDIGCFIAPLVARINLQDLNSIDSAGFVSILDLIQRSNRASTTHQGLSLAQIQTEMPQLAGGLLFNTFVSVTPSPSLESTLHFETLHTSNKSEFDLSLVVSTGTNMSVGLEYNACHIDKGHAVNIADSVTQVIGRAIQLLRQSSEHDITIPSPRDIAQICDWNSKVIEPSDISIALLLERSMSAFADREAVFAWDGCLTYRRLDHLSQALMRNLLKRHISHQRSNVLLCFKPSILSVIAQVAVCRAGGCFVMVDSSWSENRIRRIFDDNKPCAVLYASEAQSEILLLQACGKEHQTPAVELSMDFLEGLPNGKSGAVTTKLYHEAEFIMAPSANDPAYVVYTSGSTGHPKGAIITHQAVTTGHQEHAVRTRISSSSRVLLLAAPTFDMAIENIFITLFQGACLCVPSDDHKQNVVELLEFATASGANWMSCTPSYLSLFCPGALHMMDVVLLGGEPIPESIIESWTKRSTEDTRIPTIMNGFGPSECALGCCILNEAVSPQVGGRCIGRGFRATTWVVDETDHHRLLPVGATGELLLEGPCLALGYLAEATLTARSFIESPLWYRRLPGRADSRAPRFHKTGDLVRYGSDGQLFAVGRKDDQIKINGIRTEPNEVENSLHSFLPPELAQRSLVTVCLLRKFDLLAAFVFLSKHERTLETDKLERRLDGSSCSTLISTASSFHHQIVEHIRAHMTHGSHRMIPQLFIPISRIPRTTSGKTDRKALEHAASMFDKDQLLALFRRDITAILPKEVRSPVARQLARAWRQVLGSEVVSAGDNFFHLGGNSLSAIALVREVRCTMAMRLNVSIVFQYPVLGDMAQRLQSIDPGPMQQSRQPFSLLTNNAIQDMATPSEILRDELAQSCALQPDDIEDAFPCTPMQEALMTATIREMETTDGAQPYCIHAWYKLPSDIDGARMQSAWQAVLARYEILRSRIVLMPVHGTLMVVCRQLEDVELWGSSSSTVGACALKQCLEQIRFGYGTPLFRVTLIMKEVEKDNRLVLSAHHAVYDGWSLGLVWNAVMDAYHCVSEFPVPLTPKFADFVAHIRATPDDTAVDFWNHQLSHIANRSDFSFPNTPSHHQPKTTKSLRFSLTSPSAEARAAARNIGITIDTICHAGWALVVALYSSSPVVTFGSTRLGRDCHLAGIEDMVGPTSTTVPFCIALDSIDSVTAAAFLKDVQHTLRDLAPHQYLGLRKISAISPQAKLACEFSSVLTVQAVESETSLQHPSAHLNISLLEPVTRSGFHPLPLALQVFSKGNDASPDSIEADYDPACISPWLLEHALQQFDYIVGGLWRSCIGQSDLLLTELMHPAPSHLDEIYQWASASAVKEQCKSPQTTEARFLYEPFDRMAAIQPEAAAIVSSSAQYTYNQLEETTNALALCIRQHLTSQKPARSGHKIIGFCFEHSALAVIAMLAIVKTGGAMLPLAPRDANSRLQALIELSECTLVLTSPAQTQRIKELDLGKQSVEVIIMQIDSNVVADCLRVMLSPAPRMMLPTGPICPSDLAYVLFTSGTSAQGKGVMVEHGAATAAVVGLATHWGLNSRSRRLQYTDYAFDNSIEDVFGTLSAGGCIVVPSESERTNDLLSFCQMNRVNALHITPTVLRLHFAKPSLLLDSLVVGGEPMTNYDLDILHAWVASRENLQAFVAYGSTETCIDCIARQIIASHPFEPTNSIGTPISYARWRTWIVSPLTHQLAPVGAQAELYVGGPAVARGYLGSGDLSRSRFINFRDPFDQKVVGEPKEQQPPVNTMAFRTRDFMQYYRDGKLLSLGRADSQIKVHGKRIDIQAIESLIHQVLCAEGLDYDGHQRAVVEVLDDEHLYAMYICPANSCGDTHNHIAVVDQGGASSERESVSCRRAPAQLVTKICRWLERSLPSFMIPRTFFAVDMLRLTASGKCDRRWVRSVLSSVQDEMLRSTVTHLLHESVEKPMTDTERLLQRWWATVLPRIGDWENVHRESHFFDLGGHSVAAIQLASLARSAGYQLRYENIFMHPLLCNMAEYVHPIDSRRANSTSPGRFDSLPPDKRHLILSEIHNCFDINEDMIDDAYPCTPLQESIMAATAKTLGAFIMAQRVKLPRGYAPDRVKAAFQEAFETFETLRSTIVHVPSSASPLVVVFKTGPNWCKADSAGTFLETARRKHDYGQPLVRLAFSPAVSSSAPDSREELIFVAHHAAYDGSMIRAFWQRINELLEPSRTAASSCSLLPFRTFINHMARSFDPHAASEWWAKHMDGYAESVNNFPPGIRSNMSLHRPVANSSCYKTVDMSLRRQKHTTMAILARAAWSLVLSHFLASQDTVYGVVISSAAASASCEASSIDLAKVAGPTNAMIPSRTRLDFDTMNVSMLLEQVHKQSVDESLHAHLGLTKIALLSAACKAACQFTTILVIHHTRVIGDEDSEAGYIDLDSPDIYQNGQRLGDEPVVLESEAGFTPHTLIISCHPFSRGDKEYLGIHVLFDATLIAQHTAERVLDAYSTLLHNMLECALDTPLRSLSALSKESQDWIYERTTHHGSAPKPVSAFVHELISSSAMLRPQHEAVHSWDGSMTYSELECVSSAMAVRLTAEKNSSASGYGVAFMLDRSKQVLVTMLAILKAGCFFVPLDPQYPVNRLQSITRKAGVWMVVSQEKYSCTLKELHCKHLLVEDFIFQQLSLCLENSLEPQGLKLQQRTPYREHLHTKGRDPAVCTSYVLFTSGSTGEPKGVVMKHEALSTTLVALGRSPALPEGSRFLHIGNYVFDVSIYEIFVTLLYGGTVCIPSEHERLEDLEGFIGRAGVTDAAMTPSVSHALDPETISRDTVLRRLRLGGESVGLQDRIRWTRLQSNVELHCIYGVTEAAIANFHHPVHVDEELDPRLIGRPINCQSWIRSVHNPLELALPGAIGELCLEGPALAAGYMDDPMKTAEVFLTEPPWLPEYPIQESSNRSSTHQRRVYCTGDLVFANHDDGTVKFVRRSDTSRQIKLRGLRIDLGEIENAIENACSASSISVAVDLVTPSGMPPFLCAAYCNEQSNKKNVQERFDVDGMRNVLSHTLPSFMIPSYYIRLSFFPMNTVGKRDRNALREMMENAVQSERAVAQFSDHILLTQREELVRDMMCTVLSISEDSRQRIGRNADFFRLGGDSIMAVRLVALLRAHGRQGISVVDIFRNATVEKLAAMLDPCVAGQEEDKSSEEARLVKPVSLQTDSPSAPSSTTAMDLRSRQLVAEQCGMAADEIEDMYPLTATQEMLMDRMVQFSLKLPHLSDGPEDVEKLRFAFQACVARFPILRTHFVRLRDPFTLHERLLQVVLKTSHAHEQPPTTNHDHVGVFLDMRAPESRLGLLVPHWSCLGTFTKHGEKQCCRLLWTLSHALYDGWSMQLMIRAIGEGLRLCQKGPLLLSTTQSLPFRSFVDYESRARRDAGHWSFWNSYLQQQDQKCPHPRPQKQLFGYNQIQTPVRDMETCHRFTIPSPPQSVQSGQSSSTIAITVLAALMRAISDHLSCHDLLFAYVSSGRFAALPGIETCVGPTLSLLPLRIQLRPRREEANCIEAAAALSTENNDKGDDDDEDRCAPLLEQDAITIQNAISLVTPYEASGTDACREIIESMPLEIVIHPRQSSVRSYEGGNIFLENMSATGMDGGNDVRRSIFMLEVAFGDDDDVEGSTTTTTTTMTTTTTTITARWDRRAATIVEVDELVRSAIVLLT